MDNELVTVTREVEAILIPVGTPITIPADSEVTITQALGGNYTVNINGNLAQIGAHNADALGFEVSEEAKFKDEDIQEGEVNEDLIWQQMRTCYDPEIPVNMVDLGLIYNCSIDKQEDGKLELSIRVLGNELIAIKMEVNDFKMKWLIIGVGTLVALGYAVSSFGPKLMDTLGGM